MAGADVDRYTVQVPAWRRLGVEAWAAYSQSADLINGRVVYPFLGIGLALFTVCAVLAFLRDGRVPKTAAIPLYSAATLAVLGLVTTAFAAPVMLALPQIGANHAALQVSFETFHFWGFLRSVVQAMAFAASVWAMSLINRSG